jgi:hypothetical protein
MRGLRFRLRRPSPAMVIALLALFVALGGSSYAALTITSKNVKDNTLTSADLKNNSIKSIDVRDRSLLAKDFKIGQLPAGPPGAQGPPGPQGPQGPPGAFTETLGSGMTLRGYWAVSGFGALTHYDSISFLSQLPSRPDYPIVVPKEGSPSAACPGTAANPDAAPGKLCIYVARLFNVEHVGTVDAIGDTSPGASRFGTAIYVSANSTNPSNFQFVGEGTWAVTAP